jgi:hypothetical protein
MQSAVPQVPRLDLFRSEASYVLVGGLGGIGRATHCGWSSIAPGI